MGSAIEELYVELGSHTTGYVKGLAEANAASDSFEGKALGLAKHTVEFGAALTATGVGAAIALTKMGGDFQSMTTTLVTGAGESASNLGLIRQGLLDISNTVKLSTEQLTNGMYMIESAGYHGAAGLKVLQAAAEGAAVGGADMAQVADAVTSALNAYGLGADKATAITNTLVATVATGKMHMSDLASSLGAVLPAASAAHISLAELTGAIATMTMQGTPAADATTYLRMTILQLQNPSAKAVTALHDIGIKSTEVADTLTHQGLVAALALVQDHLSKKFPQGGAAATSTLADIVGGTKSMQAALELAGPHLGTFRDNVASIGDAVKQGGDKVRGWDLVQEDFNQQLAEMEQRAKSAAIGLGMNLLPAASAALSWIGTEGLHYVQEFGHWVQEHVLPTVEQLGHWMATDGLHAVQEFVGFARDNLLPIAVNIGHAFMDVGAFARDHLIPPLVEFVHIVGPPIVEVFRWLTDHEGIIIGVLLAVAGRFALIKAVQLEKELVGVGKAFVGLTQSVGSDPMGALARVLGVGGGSKGIAGGLEATASGAQALEAAIPAESKLAQYARVFGMTEQEARVLAPHLAETSDAIAGVESAGKRAADTTGGGGGLLSSLGGLIGISGAAVAGIAAVGLAAVALATDAGGVRTTLKNAIWGEDQATAVADAETALDQYHETLLKDLAVDPSGTSMQSVKDFTAQMTATLNAAWNSGNHEMFAGLTKDVMPEVEAVSKGTESVIEATLNLAGKDYAQFGSNVKAMIGGLDQSYIANAQSGKTNWDGMLAEEDTLSQNFLARFKGYNADAFDFVTQQHSAAVDAYNAHLNTERDSAVSAYGSMRSTFESSAQAEAAAAVASGKIKQDAVTKYVNDKVAKEMGAWEQVHPEYQAAIDMVHQQAIALGITDQAVEQYGQDTVVKMMDAQHAHNLVTQEIANTKKHLDDANRTTQDDARQQIEALGNVQVHVRNLNQDYDDGRRASDMWTGSIHGVMTSIDLVALHAQQDISALNQQLAHLASGGYTITVGGITHSAAGRYAASPMVSWLAEDEPEWVIPMSKAGAWGPLLTSMLSGNAPAPSQFKGGGGGAAVGMPMPVPVSGGGGGGTTVIQVSGTFVLQGVQNPEQLWDELQNIALTRAARQGAGTLWSSPQRGSFA
jgi:TP901 family phage tail tape measure protein